MNILMIGSGKGSYEIRAVQLGAALGARVTSFPTSADLVWADVVVLVKRAIVHFGALARQSGKPIVWDALDFWQQPAQNRLDSSQAVALARSYIDSVNPTVVIGATEAMANALDGVYVPHHSWRGLEPLASRAEMGLVAYQGNPLYLGRWFFELQRACTARGWRFVINPDQLWQADLIVALRDGPWDGWICREWKSGVKLSNAIAAGRPVLTQDTAAMRELQPPGTVLNDFADLNAALDHWAAPAARQDAYDVCRGRAKALRLPAIAERYRAIVATVGATCTV